MITTSVALVLSVMAVQRDGYSNEETFGKSTHDIVKMGRSGWFDYYVEKAGGETTMSMSFGEGIYGWALRVENNKTLAKLPQEQQLSVKRLRDLMYDFRTHCVNLGRMNTGGGTMWNPVYAGIEAEVEELVLMVMNPKAKAPASKEEKSGQAKVWGEIKRIEGEYEKALPGMKETLEWLKMTPEDVRTELKGMRGTFAMSVPEIAKYPAAQKAYLFGFYEQATKILEFGVE